jgi:hypothetical protein
MVISIGTHYATAGATVIQQSLHGNSAEKYF